MQKIYIIISSSNFILFEYRELDTWAISLDLPEYHNGQGNKKHDNKSGSKNKEYTNTTILFC